MGSMFERRALPVEEFELRFKKMPAKKCGVHLPIARRNDQAQLLGCEPLPTFGWLDNVGIDSSP